VPGLFARHMAAGPDGIRGLGSNQNRALLPLDITRSVPIPEVEWVSDLFGIDSDRMTCPGGIAAFDAMLALITRQVGRSWQLRWPR
jgi:hypothetical protein